jgi:hypothetical protein
MTSDNDSMMRLSSLATTLRETKSQIADLEAKLKEHKKNESRIETEDMPELMKELDMKSFTLSDGTKIEVNEDLLCGITEENRDSAHSWLRQNNFGGIIKTNIIQQYGAGEIEEATKNVALIRKLTGRTAVVLESVHAQTLKAFLKEQRTKGTKIPAKLFGLFPFSKAKVTPPKGSNTSKEN